ALAATSALAWPLLHLLLQRMPVPNEAARPIPVVEMDGEATRLPSPVPEGDLDRALYAASRAGRVDQALALVEAGADVRALPLEDLERVRLHSRYGRTTSV